MNCLRSYEELLKISQYKKKDPVIYTWAVGQLFTFYPEKASDLALQVIEDGDETDARQGIGFFMDVFDPKYLQPLRQAYLIRSGEIAGGVAALLVKAQDSYLVDLFNAKFGAGHFKDGEGFRDSLYQLVKLNTENANQAIKNTLNFLSGDEEWGEANSGAIFDANLLSGSGARELIDFCLKKPELHYLFKELLLSIGSFCGEIYHDDDISDVDEEDIAEKQFPDFLVDTFQYIWEEGKEKGFDADELDVFFEVGNYEGAVKIINEMAVFVLDKKKQETGDEKFEKWLKGKGKPRESIEVISIYNEVMELIPEEFRSAFAFSAVYLFAGFLEFESTIGKVVDEMDIDSAFTYFLVDRSDGTEDEKIIKILNNSADEKRNQIIEFCFNELWNNPETYARGRITDFLVKTGGLHVIEELLDMDGEEEELWETIVSAAFKIGEPILDRITYYLENIDWKDSRIAYFLEILGEISVEKSVQIILDHWDVLFSGDKKKCLETIFKIGDKRFINPLKSEIKDVEILEINVYRFLCQLNGIIDPMLKKYEKFIRVREKEIQKRENMLNKNDLLGFLKEPVYIELTCLICGRAYYYLVDNMLALPKTNEVLIVTDITCKNCGNVNNHYLSQENIFSVVEPLVTSFFQLDPWETETKGFIIHILESNIVDGKEMSMIETAKYWSEKVKMEPENPLNFIQLGFALVAMKNSNAGEEYLKIAMELDPMIIDPYFLLADIALSRKESMKTLEYSLELSLIIDTGKLVLPILIGLGREDIKGKVFNWIKGLSLALRKPIPGYVSEWLEENVHSSGHDHHSCGHNHHSHS